jgi:hypothetical protein
LRYRINKKARISVQTELPLLKGRQGLAADISNDVAATNRCGLLQHRSIAWQGVGLRILTIITK